MCIRVEAGIRSRYAILMSSPTVSYDTGQTRDHGVNVGDLSDRAYFFCSVTKISDSRAPGYGVTPYDKEHIGKHAPGGFRNINSSPANDFPKSIYPRCITNLRDSFYSVRRLTRRYHPINRHY